MDNLTWQAGKNLKRSIEGTGRQMNLSHLAVAVILAAREQGLSLDDIVHELIVANHFVPAPTDQEEIKRQLGF